MASPAKKFEAPPTPTGKAAPFKFVLKLVFAGALIGFVVQRGALDFAALGAGLKNPLSFFLNFGLNTIILLSLAARWKVLTAATHIVKSLLRHTEIIMVGALMGTVSGGSDR